MIFGPTCFLLYINDLPDGFICNIDIYADDTTLWSTYDRASGLWQQLLLNLNMTYEKLNWVGSRLLISMLQKLDLFFLIGLLTLVLLIWKRMGLFLRKKHLFRCWVCISLLDSIWDLTLSLLLWLPARKLESWFVL